MLALACALAALAAATLAPAFAGAQAAKDEYDVVSLPGEHGQGGGQAGGSESGGGGGAPIVFIGLVAIAAIGTGAAVWRLRDRSTERAGTVGPGAPEAASETQ